MVEVQDVTGRCKVCGMATRLLVRVDGLTMSGEPYEARYSERVPHPKEDCDRMVTLEREQWPTLW